MHGSAASFGGNTERKKALRATGIGEAAEPFRRNGAGRRNLGKPGFCGLPQKVALKSILISSGCFVRRHSI